MGPRVSLPKTLPKEPCSTSAILCFCPCNVLPWVALCTLCFGDEAREGEFATRIRYATQNEMQLEMTAQDDPELLIKVKGLMKAVLARSNDLLANDALRLLSRLMRKRALIIEPAAFGSIARNLMESALLMRCPGGEEVEARGAS